MLWLVRDASLHAHQSRHDAALQGVTRWQPEVLAQYGKPYLLTCLQVCLAQMMLHQIPPTGGGPHCPLGWGRVPGHEVAFCDRLPFSADHRGECVPEAAASLKEASHSTTCNGS